MKYDLSRIREHIVQNPLRWTHDVDNLAKEMTNRWRHQLFL